MLIRGSAKRWFWFVPAVIATQAQSPSLRAQDIDSAKLQKVQAAYLYNFTKFVQWPKSAFQNDSASFVVAVLGDGPIEWILADTLRAKRVAGHPIVFRKFQWERTQDQFELQTCHIVFINESQSEDFDEVLSALRGHPVLVVSDIHDFARSGGMIGFVLEHGRIRFQINRVALERAKLKASAKLLKLARIVESRERHAVDSLGNARRP